MSDENYGKYAKWLYENATASIETPEPKKEIPEPKKCGLYLPGHTVHWIQANRSFGGPHRDGTLLEAEGNFITVDYGNQIKRYQNDDLDRLVAIIEVGGSVRTCEEYSILRGGENYCFSIADADVQWIPCDYAKLKSLEFDDLAERLETHGGFSVSGQSFIQANATTLNGEDK